MQSFHIHKYVVSLLCVLSETNKRNGFMLHRQKEAATGDTFSFVGKCNTRTHTRAHTRKKKTDYRYPGIKDTLLPRDILLLVLTLVNITCTCTTYVAVSLLICVSCQKAACLVKSGNRNINGDGVKVKVAVWCIRPSTFCTNIL